MSRARSRVKGACCAEEEDGSAEEPTDLPEWCEASASLQSLLGFEHARRFSAVTCYHPVRVGVLRKALTPGAPRFRDGQDVACGHCLGCRGDQAREWTMRIMHETQMHESNWFLTLTYSEERLPENGSLSASDIRAFFASLRRSVDEKLSYYVCGEYGEVSQRPHYHAVLFGPHFLDKRSAGCRDGFAVWRSATVERAWRSGFSEFGAVTERSAAYVAGYVRKKIHRAESPDAYLRVDPGTGELVEIMQEFSRMSLKPAIGKRWIQKYWKDVYPWDRVVMGGREYRPPRFYDKWLEENHPDVMYEVRCKRYAELRDMSAEKLEAAEAIHRARVNLFSKRGAV